jgi:hypothetical protein
MIDKAARKQAMMDKRAAHRASMRAQRDAVNARRAAKGLKPHAYNPVSLERGMKSGGKVHKYAEGGSVYRKGADGIATKGKTRGMEVRMRKGGKC